MTMRWVWPALVLRIDDQRPFRRWVYSQLRHRRKRCGDNRRNGTTRRVAASRAASRIVEADRIDAAQESEIDAVVRFMAERTELMADPVPLTCRGAS
jgi:hypothetical protein